MADVKNRREDGDWRSKIEDALKVENLESFLFNSVQEVEENLGKEEIVQRANDSTDSDLDSDSDGGAGTEDEGAKRRQNVVAGRKMEGLQPAWEDEDDIGLEVDVGASREGRQVKKKYSDEQVVTGQEYVKRLRERHKKLHPRTAWANIQGNLPKRKRRRMDDSSDDEDNNGASQPKSDVEEEIDPIQEILSSAVNHLGAHKHLPANHIQMSRVTDANTGERSRHAIRSIDFHPEGQIMLAAGADHSLRLFSVDGVENPKLQSVFFDDIKIAKAEFGPLGEQIVVCGAGARHCYLYDVGASNLQKIQSSQAGGSPRLGYFTISKAAAMPLAAFHGHTGDMSLLSLKSRQWVGSLKMSSSKSVEGAVFSRDGLYLHATGSGGQVYVWDLRMRRCLHQWADEGALRCTSMALSPQEKYMSTGSEMGVVNLYDYESCTPGAHQRQPTPIKSFFNLTTCIDELSFNPDGQILAAASRKKPDALRLIHIPSRSVFSNWPKQNTKMGIVTTLGFSPGGGFFAHGNTEGRVFLYRLHHYGTA